MVDISYINKLVDNFEKHISDGNVKYLKALKDRNDINIIATKQNLSLVISAGIIDDLRAILLFDSCKIKERYINYTLRGMVEHVIEYKYLILNEDLIDEYFGEKTNFKDNSDFYKGKFNIVKEFKKLGKDRYESRRQRIREMAKIIGEDLTKDNLSPSSLYDIFCITSEESHNSYFLEYLRSFDNECDGEGLSESQVAFIFIIVDKFLKTYDSI